MDEMQEHNATENDTFVFLDLNGKMPNDVFEEQVFMRITNLHKKNPLVQINDSVFKGTYDYSIGTNLFFEEVEDYPPSTNVFEKQTPIHLKHILSEMKVLNLKPVKILRKVSVPNETTKIEFNLNWDYNKLLEKFEDGTLCIDDIVKKDTDIVTKDIDIITRESQEVIKEISQEEPLQESSENMETEPECNNEQTSEKEKEEEEKILQDIPIKILESDYEKLNVLARCPVKRAVSPELVAPCDKKYEEAYEYHNIERQILQPSDAFRIEKVVDINEATLSDCVDIDRCVLYGYIPSSSLFPRLLSEKEKEKILTLENFDNLSLAARYYVLKRHVKDLENYIKTQPKATLEEADEFGRTPEMTLEIYKRLCDAVMKRIQEIKQSLNSESEGDINPENIS